MNENNLKLTLFLLLFNFSGILHLPAQSDSNSELIAQIEGASNHQEHSAHQNHHESNIQFVENKNQWHSNVKFAGELGGLNCIFLEELSMTYVLFDQSQTDRLHDLLPAGEDEEVLISGHAYKVNFLNALHPEFVGNDQRSGNNNYFLGNDPNKWASDVPVYHHVTYKDIYKDIALATYTSDGNLKYDFIVAPQGNPNDILMNYEGVDNIFMRDNNLIIETSVQTIKEMEPYAYQLHNGKKVKVNCQYHLEGTTLSFKFPDGYDQQLPLVIDPTVVGATLTGTTQNENWGHSATFDNAGNIYSAGISFGTGYPTTMGAFQTNYAGGSSDIAVNKYNPTGTDMLYATYIGGSNSEYPHSTIVDFNGQLCVYGSSRSSDYPTTNNAIQASHAGSSDIIVTKLNANGSALVGSTYCGGSESDGINESTLNSNYGDSYRGEIILDDQGNIYIASCSSSSDFPTTSNAFQATNDNGGYFGSQSGILMKLNNDLSTMFWSTYLGGSGNDICFGLRLDDFNNVLATGYAGNPDFPMVAGGVQATWPGGAESGYVVKLSADGSMMLNGTFWGTSGDEHSFFIDTDEDRQGHIYGTTTGNIPITADTYSSNSGSNQFISAFSEDLSEVVYSTVIGSGGISNDFVPVAFMIDKCNGIYFSGYRASSGLPLTQDAIWTEGGSFYLGVLEPLAKGLSFATYYGEADHVDGGTSRFDKSGTVYQAVCSCQGYGGVMNTTPGAWAESQSTSCDVGVFKIDFEIPTVTAAAFASPATSGGAPFTVDFSYTGQDAEDIFWDFGNGNTSTEFNPTNTFLDAGSYTVMQIVDATNTCNQADTAFLQIDVLDGSSTVSYAGFCPGQVDLFLDVSTVNATYMWHDGSTGATFQPTTLGTFWEDIIIAGCIQRDSFIVESLSSITVDLGDDIQVCDQPGFTIDATTAGATSYEWQDGSSNPLYLVTQSGTYAVTILDNANCEAIDEIVVQFGITPDVDLGPDAELCDGEELNLDASFPGATYSWQDGSSSNELTVTETGTYTVQVNDEGCISVESIFVNFLPSPSVTFDVMDVLCDGDENGSINVLSQLGGSALNFEWDNGNVTSELSDLSPGTYFVTITNDFDCSTETSVNIETPDPLFAEMTAEDIQCNGDNNGVLSFENFSGGTPPYLFSINDQFQSENPVFSNLNGGIYTMTIEDSNGCMFSQIVEVYEPDAIVIDAGQDKVINLGEKVLINGFSSSTTNQMISWSPIDFLDCDDCLTPFANPISTTTYQLSVEDIITGCLLQDSMQVRVENPINIYIPNAFSPNGDGTNDLFFIQSDRSVNQVNYLRIYDRWGEVLYEVKNFAPNDVGFGWDGRFKGKYMNPQVLVYVTEIEFIDGVVMTFKGDFTLIR